MVTRRNGPSLLGRTAQTMARTAVIAGTATAVSNKVAAKQTVKHAHAGEPRQPEPAGLSQEAMAQLEKLAELHKSGILTDEEFAAQKARILQ